MTLDATANNNNNINNMDPSSSLPVPTSPLSSSRRNTQSPSNIFQEVWISSELLFSNKIVGLLIFGPIALLGKASEGLSEAACFAFSGIALIPCAERLSFVTEQVAEHTNGTIGALLNATFGNAPELLIAKAALLSGLYRVVQLAMLGSMLTNLLFVFGISCMIGGFRWQVQELRLVSGNVSVGLLLLAVAGSLLPAALIVSGQLRTSSHDGRQIDETTGGMELPSKEELQLCRVNAFVMIIMYGCYLVFQLGTHKEEFDEENDNANNNNHHHHHHDHHMHIPGKARRNMFCLSVWTKLTCSEYSPASITSGIGDVELATRDQLPLLKDHSSNRGGGGGGRRGGGPDDGSGYAAAAAAATNGEGDHSSMSDSSSEGGSNKLLPQNETVSRDSYANGYFDEYEQQQQHEGDSFSARRRRSPKDGRDYPPGRMLPLGLADPLDTPPPPPSPRHDETIMSFRVGIVWLFIITLCISALSDVLVDTIHGFAGRWDISEVFTSMVILPFFSNVAEQVSAVIFAYRNEMDLCVGVTVGSAIQVATFVLPGSVIIGIFVDRSMTLYFHAYETACLFLAVVVVAAVLQGGTTNWLVGATLVSIYIMIATGFWFHSLEDLNIDEETLAGGGGRHY